MTSLKVDPVQPSSRDVSIAGPALERVRSYLQQHPEPSEPIRVRVEGGGEELVLPRPVVDLLARILAHMAAGQGVSVVPATAELTTQQAADLANVSRPYLIGLLEAGEIDYRLVGRHRRVQLASLLDYLRHDDQRRRGAADELARLTQEMGLD